MLNISENINFEIEIYEIDCIALHLLFFNGHNRVSHSIDLYFLLSLKFMTLSEDVGVNKMWLGHIHQCEHFNSVDGWTIIIYYYRLFIIIIRIQNTWERFHSTSFAVRINMINVSLLILLSDFVIIIIIWIDNNNWLITRLSNRNVLIRKCIFLQFFKKCNPRNWILKNRKTIKSKQNWKCKRIVFSI